MNAGKVVLVTGTSGGIGKACALRLAQNGFQVFATVRRESDGAVLKSDARNGVTPIMMDVTDGTSIRQAFDRISEQAKDGLHGLVNNAGIGSVWPLEFFPLEEFRKTLETNLTGVLAVIQTFLPLLRRGRGRIVNISSAQDTVPAPFMGAYAASKWRRLDVPRYCGHASAPSTMDAENGVQASRMRAPAPVQRISSTCA
jgi:NAD(P)-dependent dehydrogenase (short-subunit alcohol dehydrogenase family)